MTARIISGNEIAKTVHTEVAEKVTGFKDTNGYAPGLAVVLVGDDPASRSYVRRKERACVEVGIITDTLNISADISAEELMGIVDELNNDDRYHGILVQLPLPDHIDVDNVINGLDPLKDVDGLHSQNAGLLSLGKPRFVPATPLGVQRMLIEEGIEVNGSDVVIVGRSTLVGRPLALLLSQRGRGANATVTMCHTGTQDVASHTLRADILVAAAGVPDTVTADMVKEGAVVIDVGVSRVTDSSRRSGFRLTGDVDYNAVKEKASAITPVPGGVGPMTVAMLLENVVLAAKLQSA
ncbi:MAG: bifunctional 5,10-methylenetetrahydrofolate dehydrogenase/5,10-methenyltetrahydrofolate cyclohydrolase [Chloroflexi bacterium]|nr:bifunctional 5,10-methylenetetrahydrofolate dehydrogenase/5,10-methenyltetrahydrofolate cyclohydrolase [Chloroflexota bacterium]MYF78644.1 bifunctional 5,10-methylenetetrahydrofolate dehydrogenase/5,10-methenyltetrahydrofolate cyclohydrolase [Chloroflexota bacterium]MYK61532.1 bifunctional 5,10-methylenetetrahydrofolate dehydrogenase/5,10-methenyltetrahydrofolate cyclohydrolase [Chloroflexota bacterium]